MGRGRVLTAAGPRGRQCRRPAPSAPCSRAQAPRAGGECAAFRFGWGGGGSRRRQAHEQGPAACGALGDAALPRWARGAAGVRGRRCLPCGQRRCRVARRIMACRGRERGLERFAHQGTFPARRGTGKRAAARFPARDGGYTPSRGQNAPASRQNLPHHPTAANAALYKARLIARRGKPPRRAPKTSVPRLFTTHPRLFTTYPRLFTPHLRLFTTHPAPLTAFQRLFADILHLLRHPAPAKVSFPPFPPPPHLPDHPAGRTAGSARTRPRDLSLGNPFLEATSISPVSPPPKRRRRQAPARGLAAVYSRLRPIRNETQHPSPPTRGAWVREHVAEDTGRRHCRPAGGRPLLVGLPPSIRSTAPFGTKRRTPAPCSWGGRSSTSSQRLWPSALPTTRGSWSRRRNQPCGRLRGWRNADLLRTRSA